MQGVGLDFTRTWNVCGGSSAFSKCGDPDEGSACFRTPSVGKLKLVLAQNNLRTVGTKRCSRPYLPETPRKGPRISGSPHRSAPRGALMRRGWCQQTVLSELRRGPAMQRAVFVSGFHFFAQASVRHPRVKRF